MNEFIKKNADEKRLYFEQSAADLNLPAFAIEKDFWVCWALKKLFTLPEWKDHLTFKGGTSLSKVFHLIGRFSEDCDITVDSQNFIEAINLDRISKSQLKKTSDELKNRLQNYLKHKVILHVESRLYESFKNKDLLKNFQFKLSDDGERISFYYPSLVNLENNYLRDHVLLEFGIRNSTEPSEVHQIEPMLRENEGYPFVLPIASVNTLSPIRTFWEKATLAHVECHRKRLLLSPERLSRHWYDLYLLSSSWVGEEALRQVNILNSVIQYKKAFFNASYANYDDCLVGKFKLIPDEKELKSLSDDFKKMVDAGMFQKNPPNFKIIIASLMKLEMSINQLMRE